ncbi:hypothetical protein GCM10010191_46600 [Actinomadura vinacea]|uniref:Right handed beta helix domain-containing protein n=1 Tax=Actinomadura vinacea TaxID=115336 RepID=A0ABN3JGK7_9ACTN
MPCSTASLNAAINTANNMNSATLQLSWFCTYRIVTPAVPSSGLPRITGNIALVGGLGTKIRRDLSAPTNFRIIDVGDDARLQGTGLSIENGKDATGGGILNAGKVELTDVTLSGNTATTADGGGLANGSADAEAVISRSVIRDNTAAGGGGIANSGTAKITGSRITANTSPTGGGGGILTEQNATTTIADTIMEYNTVAFGGAGILNFGATSLDQVLITQNRNSPANAFPGGGIYNVTENISPPGTVTATRSTIWLNQPDNCHPAGTIPGCAA